MFSEINFALSNQPIVIHKIFMKQILCRGNRKNVMNWIINFTSYKYIKSYFHNVNQHMQQSITIFLIFSFLFPFPCDTPHMCLKIVAGEAKSIILMVKQVVSSLARLSYFGRVHFQMAPTRFLDSPHEPAHQDIRTLVHVRMMPLLLYCTFVPNNRENADWKH